MVLNRCRLLIGLISMAFIGLGASERALAQGSGPSPKDVLDACAADIAEIIDIAEYRVSRKVTKFESKLERKAEKGRPARALDRTVRRGKKQARNAARGSVSVLRRLERGCVIELRQLGGAASEEIALFGMIDDALEELEFLVGDAAHDLDNARARIDVQLSRSNDVNLDIGDFDHFDGGHDRRRRDDDNVIVRIRSGTLFVGIHLSF